MAGEKLDLSPLERAIDRLNEGLVRYQQDTSDTQIRDGLIQRFEFTYEISHKMLKRYLEFASPTPDQYDEMMFQDLIRSGNEQGLLRGASASRETARTVPWRRPSGSCSRAERSSHVRRSRDASSP